MSELTLFSRITRNFGSCWCNTCYTALHATLHFFLEKKFTSPPAWGPIIRVRFQNKGNRGFHFVSEISSCRIQLEPSQISFCFATFCPHSAIYYYFSLFSTLCWPPAFSPREMPPQFSLNSSHFNRGKFVEITHSSAVLESRGDTERRVRRKLGNLIDFLSLTNWTTARRSLLRPTGDIPQICCREPKKKNRRKIWRIVLVAEMKDCGSSTHQPLFSFRSPSWFSGIFFRASQL